jgi:broad specificity phosphatase PhoE
VNANLTRVLLIRHAEPVAAAGRCYGRSDLALSRRGRQQAAVLAKTLEREPLAAVFSSPARRAVETALPIAAVHSLAPQIVDAFAELDFGTFENRSYEELATAEPELFRQWMERPTLVRFPGGESFTDLRARGLNDFALILRRSRGSTLAVVAHGGVTRVILASALAIPRHAVFRVDQDFACLNLIDWYDASPVVRYVNLRPLSPGA